MARRLALLECLALGLPLRPCLRGRHRALAGREIAALHVERDVAQRIPRSPRLR